MNAPKYRPAPPPRPHTALKLTKLERDALAALLSISLATDEAIPEYQHEAIGRVLRKLEGFPGGDPELGERPSGGSLLSVDEPGMKCPGCGHIAMLVVQRPGGTRCVPCAEPGAVVP